MGRGGLERAVSRACRILLEPEVLIIQVYGIIVAVLSLMFSVDLWTMLGRGRGEI